MDPAETGKGIMSTRAVQWEGWVHQAERQRTTMGSTRQGGNMHLLSPLPCLWLMGCGTRTVPVCTDETAGTLTRGLEDLEGLGTFEILRDLQRSQPQEGQCLKTAPGEV